jgi:hypothetical protein
MGKYVPDVHFLSVVMNRNNQTVFIPSDIEGRELLDLVRGGKCDLQVGEGGVIGLPENGKPVKQRGSRSRMFVRELDQPPSGDDMHSAMCISI